MVVWRVWGGSGMLVAFGSYSQKSFIDPEPVHPVPKYPFPKIEKPTAPTLAPAGKLVLGVQLLFPESYSHKLSVKTGVSPVPIYAFVPIQKTAGWSIPV